ARAKEQKNDPARFPVPLDEKGLKHINVARGAGSMGLVKNEGKLAWPLGLSGKDFDTERNKATKLMNAAVKQTSFNGFVDAATLAALDTSAEKLKKELQQAASALAPPEYIEANAFLNNLNDAIKALHQSDAGNHFTGVYTLKAKTLPELVKFMTAQRLHFTRALPGDENSYLKLYDALDN